MQRLRTKKLLRFLYSRSGFVLESRCGHGLSFQSRDLGAIAIGAKITRKKCCLFYEGISQDFFVLTLAASVLFSSLRSGCPFSRDLGAAKCSDHSVFAIGAN